MYETIFNNEQINSKEDLTHYLNSLSTCSVRIENRTRFAVDVFNGVNQIERINPYSFITIPTDNLEIKVNKNIEAENKEAYEYVAVKGVNDRASNEASSTTFNGTMNVSGDMYVNGGQIDANVVGDVNIAAGTEVNANVLGDIKLAEGTEVNATVKGDITLDPSTKVQIDGDVRIAEGAKVDANIVSGTVNATIENAEIKTELVNTSINTNPLVLIAESNVESEYILNVNPKEMFFKEYQYKNPGFFNNVFIELTAFKLGTTVNEDGETIAVTKEIDNYQDGTTTEEFLFKDFPVVQTPLIKNGGWRDVSSANVNDIINSDSFRSFNEYGRNLKFDTNLYEYKGTKSFKHFKFENDPEFLDSINFSRIVEAYRESEDDYTTVFFNVRVYGFVTNFNKGGINSKEINGRDLNEFITPGNYTGYSLANGAAGHGSGYLRVTEYNNGNEINKTLYTLQEFTPASALGVMYRRKKINGVWSDWKIDTPEVTKKLVTSQITIPQNTYTKIPGTDHKVTLGGQVKVRANIAMQNITAAANGRRIYIRVGINGVASTIEGAYMQYTDTTLSTGNLFAESAVVVQKGDTLSVMGYCTGSSAVIMANNWNYVEYEELGGNHAKG